MENNYVVRLYEYAQKTHAKVRFEEVDTDGPDHIKKFTTRAVVNNQAYPDGVGLNKKEAKQNAAKHALDGLLPEAAHHDSTTSATQCPSEMPATAGITQPNFQCWLNEYAHKSQLLFKPMESTRMDAANTSQCCKYIAGDKEFPEAYGKNKKDAREKAAKLVYQELNEPTTEGEIVSGKNLEWLVKFGHRPTTVVLDENCNGTTRQKPGSNLSVSSLSETIEHFKMSSTTETQSIIPETNYIGLLNTYCQKTKLVHDFQLVEKRGPAHDPEFVYKLVINKKEYPEGLGKTAKEAKQHAAQLAWTALQEQSDWNSEVSFKSTVSEDDTPSLNSTVRDYQDDSTPKTMPESASANDSIIFKEASPGRPKIKLAANFKMAPSSKEVGHLPNLNANNLGKPSKDPSNQSTPSRFLEEFKSIKPIGKGGFGRVFQAKRELEQKYFAVKIVRCTEKARREVGALADLQHCNIVRYYTAWIEDATYKYDNSDSDSTSTSGSSSDTKFLYIQMELCVGDTLRLWIDERNARKNPKRRLDALHITQQIVLAVAYIHLKKLIHRDLKPANIMFGHDGEVKVGDFGLVTAAESDNDESLLERTKRTGTRSYMSPEQRNQSSYDRKVDVFALGLIYFELLWNLSTGMEKQKIWHDVRSKTFPQRFCEQFSSEHKLIERMLCEGPEDRPDARELVTELEKCSLFLQGDQNAHRETRTC